MKRLGLMTVAMSILTGCQIPAKFRTYDDVSAKREVVAVYREGHTLLICDSRETPVAIDKPAKAHLFSPRTGQSIPHNIYQKADFFVCPGPEKDIQ